MLHTLLPNEFKNGALKHALPPQQGQSPKAMSHAMHSQQTNTHIQKDMFYKITLVTTRAPNAHFQYMNDTLPGNDHKREDGVPRWRGESATFFSWSTPLTCAASWTTRHTVVGLTSSAISRATRREIISIIAWDLQALRLGVFPRTDHKGRPFPVGSAAALRAGCPIAQLSSGALLTGVFSNWKGDQEAAAIAHDSWGQC